MTKPRQAAFQVAEAAAKTSDFLGILTFWPCGFAVVIAILVRLLFGVIGPIAYAVKVTGRDAGGGMHPSWFTFVGMGSIIVLGSLTVVIGFAALGMLLGLREGFKVGVDSPEIKKAPIQRMLLASVVGMKNLVTCAVLLALAKKIADTDTPFNLFEWLWHMITS